MLAQRQVTLCLLLVLTGVTSYVTIPVRRDYGNVWASQQRQRQGQPSQHLPSCDGRHLSITKVYATTNEITNDIPKNVKLLILPGFGNVMGDYILSSNPDDSCDTSTTCRTGSLLQSFINRGWKYNENIFILPIRQRYEWIQVFLYGLFDIQFLLFSNAPPTNPAFLWYLQKIKTVIQEQILHSNPSASGNTIENDDGDNQPAATAPTDIILIGHSAGGWLGRAAIAYLLHQQHNSFTIGTDRNYIVRGLVTLGAPHLPPPITAMDMTRGALRYTDAQYPGAFQHYSNGTTTMTPISRSSDAAISNKIENNTIFYITVCGNSVQGQKNEEATASLATTSSSSSSKVRSPSTQIARFAYNSYEAVCGDGTTLGDGVVPLCSAHLQNAIQITLPNIYHSINVPEQWYGTDTIFAFDVWYNRMMEQVRGKH